MSEVTHSLNDLKVVNTKVNLFPYKSEVTEDWTPIDITKEDDCDGYATAKQWRLVHAYGWPEKATRLATCFVEPSAGEKRTRGHLVLLVDLGGTTYVLDNRYPHPMEYDLVPYEWHRIYNHDMQAWEWANGADRSFI